VLARWSGRVGHVGFASRAAVLRYRAVLTARDPGLLFGASVLSVAGDWLNTVALIALSYQFGEGALGVGGLVAIRMLPRVVLQGPAGALVDRVPGRRLLIITHLLLALIAGAFIVLTVVPSLWLLYGLVLGMDTVATVADPTFVAQLMVTVAPEQRGTTYALQTMGMNVAQFTSAPLGGLLLAWLGATPLFLLNALTFLAIALAATQLRDVDTRTTDPVEAEVASEDLSTVRQREPTASAARRPGYRLLLRVPAVVGYVAITFAAGLLLRGVIPLFAVRSYDLGLGDGGVGVFFGAMAVGQFAGGVVAGTGTYLTRSALYVLAGAGTCFALSLSVFGFAPVLWWAIASLVVAGLSAEIDEVAAMTFFQHHLPDAVFGRFFSLFLIASRGGSLVGALLAPLLAEITGAGWALAILALPVLALALALGVATRVWPQVVRIPHPV
jgi:MFS family permease